MHIIKEGCMCLYNSKFLFEKMLEKINGQHVDRKKKLHVYNMWDSNPEPCEYQSNILPLHHRAGTPTASIH